MDRFDIGILRALQEDGRLTNQELGDKVGLSPSQCSRRRVSLESAGYIESYNALLSAKAIGLGVTVFVRVALSTHSPENSARFLQLITSLEEVQEAYSLTGDTDYLVRMTVPGLAELADILNSVFLPHDSVAHVHTSIVLDRLKQSSCLPLGHLETKDARK